MKAVVWTKFGPPETLKYRDLPKPVPKDDEVLIKIYATSVHRGDVRMRALDVPFPWWTKIFAWVFLGITLRLHPVLGMELSGKVEAVGKNVTNFKVGDEVFAETASNNLGAYAEFKCMKADSAIALKPKNLSFAQVSVIPAGGITTLGMVKNANIHRQQKVLIYGASGSIGTFAIQLCKNLGADITGVCSTNNLELVKSLGAGKVIDYTNEDFTTEDQKYDIVFDAVGKLKREQAVKVLKQDGLFLNIHVDSDKVKKKDFPKLLSELRELCEEGKLQAVIDRTYSLDEIVEAHRYVDSGHKRGNVAIIVAKDE